MLDIPNAFYRVSAKALVLDKDKKVLLIREETGMWELPGGGVDHGETAHETIAREIQEEMGLEVSKIAKDPKYITIFENVDIWTVNLLFETELKNLNFISSDECREIGFFDKAAAMKLNAFPSVKAFMEKYDPNKH